MSSLPPVAPAVSKPRFTFNGNTPTFHPTPSPKTIWQHTVVQADLPFHTKGILLIVATEWMNADGGSCFPTEEQIMAKAGVSRPCLTRHMRIAVEGGFIERWHWGHGNKNRRYNYRAIIPGQPAPTDEMGNVVSYPTGEMGNDVSQHKPSPIDNQFQKEREATAEPSRPEPAPQPQAAHSQESLRTIKTPPPDCIPDGWLERAINFRSDLPAEQIKTSIENFLDRNRAKGLRLVDWEAELRVWLRRERAVKPHQNASTATPATNRYAHLDAKETPVSAAVRASLELGEQRRIEFLIQSGIDPATGWRIEPPAAAPRTPSNSTMATPIIPGRSFDPSVDTRPLTEAEECNQFEEKRRIALAQLAALQAAKAAAPTTPPINDQPDQSYAARLAALEARIAARKAREAAEREAGG